MDNNIFEKKDIDTDNNIDILKYSKSWLNLLNRIYDFYIDNNLSMKKDNFGSKTNKFGFWIGKNNKITYYGICREGFIIWILNTELIIQISKYGPDTEWVKPVYDPQCSSNLFLIPRLKNDEHLISFFEKNKFCNVEKFVFNLVFDILEKIRKQLIFELEEEIKQIKITKDLLKKQEEEKEKIELTNEFINLFPKWGIADDIIKELRNFEHDDKCLSK